MLGKPIPAEPRVERGPSQSWLIAQQLLGKPVLAPDPALAAQAAEECRKYREFLAAITGVNESIAWDPGKHPRGHFSQNRGWFSPKGTGGSSGTGSESSSASVRLLNMLPLHPSKGGSGAEGSSGSVRSSKASSLIGGAPFTLSKPPAAGRVRAQFASWVPAVGHHWMPIQVIYSDDIRHLLSDDAVAYAMGSSSGKTNPSHGNRRYGGYTHSQYSQRVKSQLRRYMHLHKIKKMSAEHMDRFLNLVENGLDAAGKPDPIIRPFNRAIKELVEKTGKQPKRSIRDVIEAGKKYMKHSRFKLLAAAAIISGVLSDVVSAEVEVLNVASKSQHYQRALQALSNGDIATAQGLLIGETDSLYVEILVEVGYRAAANYKRLMERVIDDANKKDYK